jgi:hypothetical protein
MPVALRSQTAVPMPRALMRRAGAAAVAAAVLAGSWAGFAEAALTLPEIRLSAHNAVPACVTPERLMAFLKRRNGKLDPRFRNIASYYKKHGEAWGVRWDYAFFQMAIETNFLTYRQPNGRMGDVDPKQNNFAGIGTTGGGVPGDSFPDVSTGVLGQIQHLVVYSGETVPSPVAPRTQLKQEHILAKSHALNRPVRFSDLAGRWAADRKYGGSIEWVAERFRAEQCNGRAIQDAEALPWQQQKSPSRASADGKSAAPAAKKGAAQADASPSVRTIWSREQPRADAKAKQAAPPPPTATAPKAPDVAVAPIQPPEAPAPAEAAQEPEAAHFALFTPPAGLAEARIDAARGPTRAEPSAQMTSPAEASSAAVAPRPVAPAEADVAAPQVPAAVSGKTVAGFLIGGGSAGKPDYPPPSGLGVKPGRCVIETARYGGETTVLVKAPARGDTHYVALSVLDGFEDSMTRSFLASRPEGGEVLGTYPSRDAAIAKARTLCAE